MPSNPAQQDFTVMLNIDAAKDLLRTDAADAWLIYSFRNSNPVFSQIVPRASGLTRRAFMIIPQSGDPSLVAHIVDGPHLSHTPYHIYTYNTWHEMQSLLQTMLSPFSRVAMEYSPGGAVPAASWVDAGTVDSIRALGLEVISSADVFQAAAAAWSDTALASHLDACRHVSDVRNAAFDYIRQSIHSGRIITELDVQELIMSEFVQRGLETEDRPIVAVNSNSGNPHYEPTSEHTAPIRAGDWILIDLWARHPGDANVFADITWVGYAGTEVPQRHAQVFAVVKSARDSVIQHLARVWERREHLQGWQLDRVARDHIINEGFGAQFVHRTGHSIGPGATLHALGVNLDDHETHDTRTILPRIGFSIEPGIYLPEFGVRLEVNVYIDPQSGPRITTPIQDEVVCLL